MSNQVVLITGGLTGIGRAAAVAFAKKGAKVVVAGRRDEAGNALVKELRAGTDEAGHAFQFEAGRVFRSEAGHPWRQSHGSI